jgi:hypothetical protein
LGAVKAAKESVKGPEDDARDGTRLLVGSIHHGQELIPAYDSRALTGYVHESVDEYQAMDPTIVFDGLDLALDGLVLARRMAAVTPDQGAWV